MLFDPKWDTKTDQFTLENLIAWLEKQPADQTYDYTNVGKCLLGQWVRSIDPDGGPATVPHCFSYRCNAQVVDLGRFQQIASNSGTRSTFGAALESARRTLG